MKKIFEPQREIDVIQEADVIVVGGGPAGIGAALAAGRASPAKMCRDRLRDTLLERRDRYVADRINRTLGAGETGILFMGMLHEVTRSLEPDIQVVYPLGGPPVRQGTGA